MFKVLVYLCIALILACPQSCRIRHAVKNVDFWGSLYLVIPYLVCVKINAVWQLHAEK